MRVCGAKTRAGGTCKQAAGGNGRCYLHGKRAGRPPSTGRDAGYTAAFGPRFAELAADPNLLRANVELAFFDTFLLERAETLRDGFSSGWIDDLKAVSETIDQAVKQVDVVAVKASLSRLKELIRHGGDRQQAWGEALAAAKQRADIAAKADANAAKREQTVTDRDIAGMMCRWLEIVSRIADAETSRRVYAEFKREIIDVGPRAGDGGAAGAFVDRAGVPAVH